MGSYAPNGYGLYDMAGNVVEHMNEMYDSNYYSISPPNNPPGPATGAWFLYRDGSFQQRASDLRVANRISLTSLSHLGFRCARGGAFGP